MNLYEFQGKQVFKDHGIPVPRGITLTDPDAKKVEDAPMPCVVKAQVLTGGRGKAGGIALCDTVDEAREAARRILGMDIKGHTVGKVLLEAQLDIERELYLAVLLDRSARDVLVMASAEGGVDIESVADDDILQLHVDPLTGITDDQVRKLTRFLALSGESAAELETVLRGLYETFTEEDCELCEVNPLAVTAEGLVAADAKVTVDDNALFRHDWTPPKEERTELEQKARDKGIAFIQLDGHIGVIANGAGLTMATLDALTHYGGAGGVFLDLGGTDDPEQVKEAVLLMKEADPSVVLINLFGGITKTDTVARGILQVLESEGLDQPVVARIKGRNEKKAKALLKDAGFVAVSDLKEAAERTVEIDRKERGVD